MILFRIIYAVLLVAAFVFSSFYGGDIPELIRYTLIFIPVVLLIYLCCVYMRLSLKQTIRDRVVTRGEPVEYTFLLRSRDVIPYLNLGVHFYEHVADIEMAENIKEINILPRSDVLCEGKIICRYAGVYNIGISEIDIPDFFRIFRFKYKCRKPIRVHVRPQKIHIKSIKSCILAKDSCNSYNQNGRGNDVCGNIIRNYIPGDSMKMIHWKNSAKMHKIVTRQNEEIFEDSTALIIDTRLLKISITDRIIAADKILHSVVAIVESFVNDRLKIEIYYKNMGQTKSIYIGSSVDFDMFYEHCQDITFLETQSAAGLIYEVRELNYGHGRKIIIIAYAPGEDIMSQINECIKYGCRVTLINIIRNEKDERHSNDMMTVINMYVEDDICEVLSD